jgi:hypothetical protein
MGGVPKFTPPTENYFMKLQQLIYKVEELRALTDTYEQTQKALAQGTALQATMGDESTEEDKATVNGKIDQLRTRMATVTKLLLERAGGSTEDEAVERVQQHVARLQQYQHIRGEQLQLRTQLDLELAMGDVPLETRQQAESTLQSMQARLETLVLQSEDAFPGPRLVTLG